MQEVEGGALEGKGVREVTYGRNVGAHTAAFNTLCLGGYKGTA